jgi:hypothetical protein
MDILYYSNYCAHSKKVIQFVAKEGLGEKINCICIDKRTRDSSTGQTVIILESGKMVPIPPNVHSVPALLLVNRNYNAIFGDEIVKYYQPLVSQGHQMATAEGGGEPSGFVLGIGGTASSNIMSEQYTLYNMSSDDLSAKGRGGNRPLYNYVPASQDVLMIQTPPDTYRPDKLTEGTTIDVLQQKRNEEIRQQAAPNQYNPRLS